MYFTPLPGGEIKVAVVPRRRISAVGIWRVPSLSLRRIIYMLLSWPSGLRIYTKKRERGSFWICYWVYDFNSGGTILARARVI